jgi:hypothetical protein
MQAQDRAYRLGQTKPVTVYRLIAQGTIEELMFMRQLYKVYLSEAAMESCSKEGDCKFEGVEGESDGELFGIYNLLQYEDGSILQRLQAEYADELLESTVDALPGFEHLDTNGVGQVLGRARLEGNELLLPPPDILNDGSLDSVAADGKHSSSTKRGREKKAKSALAPSASSSSAVPIMDKPSPVPVPTISPISPTTSIGTTLASSLNASVVAPNADGAPKRRKLPIGTVATAKVFKLL